MVNWWLHIDVGIVTKGGCSGGPSVTHGQCAAVPRFGGVEGLPSRLNEYARWHFQVCALV